MLASLVIAAGACGRVRLDAGEVRADLEGAPLHVVAAGTVLVLRGERSSRREVVVAVAGRDDVLLPPGEGETVRALEAAELVPVPAALPRAAASAVAAGLAAAVRERDETIAVLATAGGQERLRRRLLRLARRFGRVTSRGVAIPLPLTHDLLGAMIGATRETVTVSMRALERDGTVRREGRTYVVALGALGEAEGGAKGILARPDRHRP